MEQSRVSFLLDNDLFDKFTDKCDKESKNQSHALRELVENFVTNNTTIHCMHIDIDGANRVLFNFVPLDGSFYKCTKCGKIIKSETLQKIISERPSCQSPYSYNEDMERALNALNLWRSRI